MPHCPNGHPNDADSRFCSECGEPLAGGTPESQTDEPNSASASSEIDADDGLRRFVTSNGRRLRLIGIAAVGLLLVVFVVVGVVLAGQDDDNDGGNGFAASSNTTAAPSRADDLSPADYDDFLRYARGGEGLILVYSDDVLIDNGFIVCDMFDSGANPQELMRQAADDLPAEDAYDFSHIAVAAAEYLCPEHAIR